MDLYVIKLTSGLSTARTVIILSFDENDVNLRFTTRLDNNDDRRSLLCSYSHKTIRFDSPRAYEVKKTESAKSINLSARKCTVLDCRTHQDCGVAKRRHSKTVYFTNV